MARLFPVSGEQQFLIGRAVEADAISFFASDQSQSGVLANLAPFLELMVHGDVAGPLPANIGHGLPQSPRCPTSDGGLVFLSGGRNLGLEVATRLVEALSIDAGRVLYIPHAYARPDEMESLQDDFSGNVVEVRGRVYVRSCGSDIEPELVRRALACMIGGYSVAWLLGSDLPDVKPCSAVVPVFDGEGWAVLGQSILPAVKKH